MLTINKINSTYRNSAYPLNAIKSNIQPSFGMSVSSLALNNPSLKKSALTALAKLSTFSGEKANIIINSAGKFFIAPAMIMFNPFLKESKEDKGYSAGKQVVAAGFNLVSQLGINITAEKLLNKLAKANKLGPAFNLNTAEKEAAQLAQKRLKILNDSVGLAATLALIPLVVKITNWVYPKIMEKIYPTNKRDDD
ncbi:MAG: hypothetical protein A2104_00295 [Candidatus Melainabacteria bacterium GWF2_32_7]|nr:MAG: hypothetical protein A2104_00295 [Candidatus Melainabacteria bacterium GWF2_32_7]